MHRPLITALAPSVVAVGGAVTLTGSHFAGTTAVSIGGTPVTSFAVVTDEDLTCVVAGGTTTGRVAVTTPSGTTTSLGKLTIIAASPVITGISPTAAAAGALVAVTGTGLIGTTAVRFGGHGASFTVLGDTLIAAVVGTIAVTGKIQVVTPIGTVSSPATFTYVPTPVITGFFPVTGPVSSSISISGSGFTGASAVSVGGTPVTSFVVQSDILITAVLAGGTTTGVVSVTNTNGTGTSADAYAVIPAPTITSFTPSSGPDGTSVAITGTHLLGASHVALNGLAAQVLDVSATLVTAITPAGTTTGTITVTTPGGTVTSGGTFTATPAPSIDYFDPGAGQIGDTLTVYGAGMTGVTALHIGTTACTGVSASGDTSASGTIAGGTTTGPVSATNPAGTGTTTALYVIEATPTVSAYAPTSGAVGTAVVITGSGFTGTTVVDFAGTPASFAVLSDTSISATVPLGAVTGTVTATNPAGTGTGASFTVPSGSAPTVSSLTPNHGTAGTSVVIAGTGFTGATHVSFNGTLASAFSVDSDIQVTATTATGVSTGPVSVTTAGGTGTSGGNFSNP